MFRRRRTGGAEAAPVTQPTEMPSAGTGHRYRMVQKMVAIGDDFFIVQDDDLSVARVHGVPVDFSIL